MKRLSRLCMVIASVELAVALTCSSAPTPASGTPSSAAQDADKEWTMPNKNAASTRGSAASSIRWLTVDAALAAGVPSPAGRALWLDAAPDPEMIVVLRVTDHASVATDAW